MSEIGPICREPGDTLTRRGEFEPNLEGLYAFCSISSQNRRKFFIDYTSCSSSCFPIILVFNQLAWGSFSMSRAGEFAAVEAGRLHPFNVIWHPSSLSSGRHQCGHVVARSLRHIRYFERSTNLPSDNGSVSVAHGILRRQAFR